MIHVFRSVDAHVGGAAVRVIVDGVPRPLAQGLGQRPAWLKRHGELLRRVVMLEPRGHEDLSGAWLTTPVTPGAGAGLLFVDSAGFPPFAGAATIGAITVAIERRLIDCGEPELRLAFDTPAGTVHARPRLRVAGEVRRVDSVVLTTLPSFVAVPGLSVSTGVRALPVDVAYAGVFLAIADSEAIGIPLEPSALPELRRLAVRISRAAAVSAAAVHPGDAALGGLGGVVFTSSPRDPEAHLRSVTITASGAVDRSASIAGTGAVMAVLDAMGLLPGDQPFVHESIIGTLHRGRIAHRTQVADMPAIVPEIEASAWITGEHAFCVDDDDPLKDGFLLGTV